MTNTSAAEKPQKVPGAFRTGAVVPSLLLIALVYAYFYFLFDSHLRRGIEFVAGRMHGAEVNIGSVKTSFLHASFRMRELEVTDKEHPERNLFQVGDIRFQMNSDALLRAKAVVEDASVLDIQAFTPRKHPGFVTPSPPPTENTLLARAENEVLAQTQSRFNGNFLGDLANVLGGGDPKEQLKNIQGELKAAVRAQELEQEIAAKKIAWEKRVRELPQPADIKALEAKVKALNLSTKNPMELAKNLKQAKEILAEAQKKITLVEQSQKDLTNDLSTYSQAVTGLEKLAEQDVLDLQKRLQIPGIDPKDFSTQLFLSLVEKRLVSVRKYITIARKYMPAKKTPQQKQAEAAEQLVPRKRGEGRTYAFPVTQGYPLFWLKKAALSSELTQSEWAGKVSGELLDVSTDPALAGRPTRLHLAGGFPKQKITGLDFLATLDHTGEKAKESIKATVGSFPVANQMLSESSSVRFGLKEAQGALRFDASLVEQTLDIGIQSRFQKPQFELEAKNQQLQTILAAVLQGISEVTMNAKVTGSWDKFNLDIDSNLGRELSAGFQKQLQAKLGDAKAKLHALVEEKIGGPKRKVQEQLAALTGGPGKLLGQNKEEMTQNLKGVEGGAKGSSSSPIDSMKEEGKKKLLKKFGF